MPTELRKIVFTRRELIEAFNVRAPGTANIPAGQVQEIHVYQKFGGGVKVLLDVEDESDNRLKRFNLDAATISEVLLDYCAKKDIPIARDAAKYLEVIGDNLALSQKIRGQELFEEHIDEEPFSAAGGEQT